MASPTGRDRFIVGPLQRIGDIAMATRVYVVEDHRVMREALVEYLQASGEVEVCGAVAKAAEALNGIPAARPSLVLVDLSLPDTNGLELLGEIRRRWAIPCMVLTGQGGGTDQGQLRLAHRALAAGAQGFLRKGQPHEILVAIRQVLQGGVYFPESVENPGPS